jgi:hypothetical protein
MLSFMKTHSVIDLAISWLRELRSTIRKDQGQGYQRCSLYVLQNVLYVAVFVVSLIAGKILNDFLLMFSLYVFCYA